MSSLNISVEKPVLILQKTAEGSQRSSCLTKESDHHRWMELWNNWDCNGIIVVRTGQEKEDFSHKLKIPLFSMVLY